MARLFQSFLFYLPLGKGFLSSNQADEDHNDRYDQEDVDESSYGVGSDEA